MLILPCSAGPGTTPDSFSAELICPLKVSGKTLVKRYNIFIITTVEHPANLTEMSSAVPGYAVEED